MDLWILQSHFFTFIFVFLISVVFNKNILSKWNSCHVCSLPFSLLLFLLWKTNDTRLSISVYTSVLKSYTLKIHDHVALKFYLPKKILYYCFTDTKYKAFVLHRLSLSIFSFPSSSYSPSEKFLQKLSCLCFSFDKSSSFFIFEAVVIFRFCNNFHC